MKKISVIVPVYNVEKYLDQCVLSIINQTYKNLEIILVDDGSKDNSGKICDKYIDIDPRIKVIHKQNGGLSSARNAGMEIVTGDFIMFCDSDDFFLPDSCLVMLNEIENKNADYVIGNIQNCSDDGTLWSSTTVDEHQYNNFKLDITDYKNSFFIMNSSVCNKIFRKSFIDSLNVKFIEGIPAEDAIFTTYCFIKSKSVYFINDVVYIYRQRSDGSSISTHTDLNYFKGISRAYKRLYLNFKKNNQLGFYRFYYLKNLTYIIYRFIDSDFMTDEEKISVLKDLSWFFNLSVELKVTHYQENIVSIINHIVNKNYEEAIKVCNKVSEFRSKLTAEEKQNMSKPRPDVYDSLLNSGVIYE